MKYTPDFVLFSNYCRLYILFRDRHPSHLHRDELLHLASPAVVAEGELQTTTLSQHIWITGMMLVDCIEELIRVHTE
jgi:hypothetical protein